ncbi:2'-5' RNA ligase family protein [Gillisia sp. Q332]|uniref:2'-5' RNA ligase family protein n=1 Tax=Gillisia xinjiangensis TaxID=3384765 RepID=UPI003918F412
MSLYFIALIPPEALCERIRLLKLEIADKYEAKHALKLPAHITLQIPFRIPNENESDLIELLKGFAAKQHSFTIKIFGFRKFSNRIIFADVETKQPVIELYESLQDLLTTHLNLKDHEKTSKIDPHFTLASRDLNHRIFPTVWADFKEREFQDSFQAKSIFLLKHNGKNWDIFKEFEFAKL